MLGRTVSAADNGFSADVENASFSKEDVNAFILSSPGVPKGITMQEYAASFPKLIKSNYLDKLLEDERWKG